jgi:hypothetical protein
MNRLLNELKEDVAVMMRGVQLQGSILIQLQSLAVCNVGIRLQFPYVIN